MSLFADRRNAGRQLAEALAEQRDADALVLGLARGGVIVAAAVAVDFGADLDVLIVRKLGAPANPEYAVGAVVEGCEAITNPRSVARLGLSTGILRALIAEKEREIGRLREEYRQGSPLTLPRGRKVILVDDGLATGTTMRAAVIAMRFQGAARVDVACPVGSSEAVAMLRQLADRVTCLATPPDFFAVGSSYERFDPTSDDEVRQALEEARARRVEAKDVRG